MKHTAHETGWLQWGWRGDLLQGPISPLLDHLRWLAALAVTAAHTRNLVFVDHAEVTSPTLWTNLFYFLTLFGTQAVVVFFVISGLLVGGKLVSDVKGRRFRVRVYAIDRLTRLGIVLVPAVALSLALQWLDGRALDAGWTIAGNLMFGQNVWAEPLRNNHPLWSLSNEAVYYVLAGLMAAGVACGAGVRTLSLLVLPLLMAGLWWVEHGPVGVLAGAPLWVCGLLPWCVRLRLPGWAAAGLLAGALVLSRLHVFPWAWLEGLAIAVSLAACLCARWRWRLPSGAWAAGFSYSLYLVHMPVALALTHGMALHQPSEPAAWGRFGLVLVCCLLTAWAFGRVFEDRTAAVRRWALERWGHARVAAPASPI